MSNLIIRVNDDERAGLQAAADAVGKPLSDYVREALVAVHADSIAEARTEAERRHERDRVEAERRTELARAGVWPFPFPPRDLFTKLHVF